MPFFGTSFFNACLPDTRPGEFYKVSCLRFDIYKLSFFIIFMV